MRHLFTKPWSHFTHGDRVWLDVSGTVEEWRFKIKRASAWGQILPARRVTRGGPGTIARNPFNRGHRWEPVAALPLAEEGSRRPAAAAALKCGWRTDLSSTRRSRVSSSERRWCCSRSRTSTCSLTDRVRRRRGRAAEGGEKKNKTQQTGLQAEATSWSLLRCPASSQLIPLLWCIPHGAEPQVLHQREQTRLTCCLRNTNTDPHLDPRKLAPLSTFFRSISLLIASHLFPSLCCTFSEQHTPPLVKTLPSTKHFPLMLKIIPRMHHVPPRLSISTHFALHSFGCCAMRMLSPLMLPPQLYTTLHTRAHAHRQTHTPPPASKPLRPGSSNSPIKSAFLVWHWTSWLLRKPRRDYYKTSKPLCMHQRKRVAEHRVEAVGEGPIGGI